MMTSEIVYLGELRTKNTHSKSGESIITDAPVDNNGKGEAFSPTDLVATALGNCILTVMGIKARDIGADLTGTEIKVKKHMAADPRRISRIDLDIIFNKAFDDKTMKILEHTARTCPVAQSINADIDQNITFNWVE